MKVLTLVGLASMMLPPLHYSFRPLSGMKVLTLDIARATHGLESVKFPSPLGDEGLNTDFLEYDDSAIESEFPSPLGDEGLNTLESKRSTCEPSGLFPSPLGDEGLNTRGRPSTSRR